MTAQPAGLCTLGYLREELNFSVESVQRAVEAYVEDSENASILRDVCETLRQMSGALTLAGEGAASAFVNEIRALAQAIADSGQDVDGPRAALLRGVLCLKPYLETLHRARRGFPVMDVSPVTAVLRSARGLDAANGPVASNATSSGSTVERALVHGLRPGFQKALVLILRGKDLPEQFARAGDVLCRLRDMATKTPVYDTWWWALRLLRALTEGVLDPIPGNLMLLGVVDRQIKLLIDKGEDGFTGDTVRAVADSIEDALAPVPAGKVLLGDRSDYRPPGPIAGSELPVPDQATLRQIAETLAEDLTLAQDVVDRTARGQPDVAASADLLQRLRAGAGVLAMLNVSSTASLLTHVRDSLTRLQVLDLGQLDRLATDLLILEESLQSLSQLGPMMAGAGEGAGSFRDEQARIAAAHQALREIGELTEKVTSLANEKDAQGWSKLIPQLRRIANVFTLLSWRRAAELAQALGSFLERRDFCERCLVEDQIMDAFAEGILAIEYAVLEADGGVEAVGVRLDHGEECLRRISTRLDAPGATDEDVQRQIAQAALPAVELDLTLDGDYQEPDDASPVAPDATLAPPPVDGLEWADDGVLASDELQDLPAPKPAETDHPSAISLDLDSSHFDSGDSGTTSAVKPTDPAWEEISFEPMDEGDISVTGLSGTGEIASATPDDAELEHDDVDAIELVAPWFEPEQDLPVTNATEIPDVLEDLENGAEVASGDELAPAHHELAARIEPDQSNGAGERADEPESACPAVDDDTRAERRDSESATLDETARASAAELVSDDTRLRADIVADECNESPAWSDHEFLEVFLEEAEEAMAGLAQWVPAWQSDLSDQSQLREIRRAYHTLKGSGRMVAATKAGDFAGSVESLLNQVLDGSLRATPALVTALERATAVLGDLIQHMQSGDENVDLSAASAALEAVATGDEQNADSAYSTIDEAREFPPGDALIPDSDSTPAPEAGIGVEAPETAAESAPSPEAAESTGDSLDASREGIANHLEVAEANISDFSADDSVSAAPVESQDLTASPGLAGEQDLAFEEAVASPEHLTQGPPSESAQDECATHADQVALADLEDGAGVNQPEPLQGETDPDLDSELVEVFVQEALDILDSSDLILTKLVNAPNDRAVLNDLRREMHTLKGSSRMAGFLVVGDLAHALESLLDAVARGELRFSARVNDLMQRALDRLHAMVEVAQGLVQPEAAPDLVDQLRDRDALATVVEPVAIAPKPVLPSLPSEATPTPSPAQVGETVVPVGDGSDMVRMSARLLERISNQIGEGSINRERIAQGVGGFHYQLVEMEQTLGRLREKLRRLEIETETQILFRFERSSEKQREDFDPLELDRFSDLQQLSRSLLEVVNDLYSIQGALDDNVQSMDSMLHQQEKIDRDLQEDLTRTRMVRFDSQIPRMRRVVRLAADELGKKAELVVEPGAEIERGLLEHLAGPLEHVLRNAVSHGIEEPPLRIQAGKPETGKITLTITREGSELVLAVTDDGGGINFEAVRRKAVEQGLLAEDQDADRDTLIACMMRPGFSTAARITQISGRGVGMDAINDAVRSLGGSAVVQSEDGQGTRLVLRLPYSMSVARALLVRAGRECYAIPLAGIDGVVRVEPELMREYLDDGGGELIWGERRYELRSLGALLGSAAGALEDLERPLPAVLVRSGGSAVALQVDTVLGSSEVIVKPVGPQVNSVPGVSGASIMGDGRVVLVLEPAALIRSLLGRRPGIEVEALREALASPEQAKLQIMVVDDSITMRKVATRLLQKHGAQVILAKDGLDAAGQLEDSLPDALVLDIEMPRMDGFELAAHIRNQEHLWHLPIVMVTSRSGDKHRQRAMNLGVNAYLGKPYREEELLTALRQILGARGARLR
jgi:chemosensory pili system protein ChpA (sensor histidine kinase/response regulator)